MVRHVDIGVGDVVRYLREYDEYMAMRMKYLKTKKTSALNIDDVVICVMCNEPFTKTMKMKRRVFCSDKCRYDYWNIEKKARQSANLTLKNMDEMVAHIQENMRKIKELNADCNDINDDKPELNNGD